MTPRKVVSKQDFVAVWMMLRMGAAAHQELVFFLLHVMIH
jgi:hypothetical protein